MTLKFYSNVSGSPIVADPDPNTTEPARKRIVGTPIKNGHVGGGTWDAYYFCTGGTSVDVSAWVRIPEMANRWFDLNMVITVGADEGRIVQGIPPDAEVFFQIRVVVGAVTNFGTALF